MPQSLSAVHVHLVFSTKDRAPFLRDTVIRDDMHAYLGGVSNRLACDVSIVGGTADHVHLLATLGRSITQADWVKELKRSSNVWVKEKYQKAGEFSWQSGYGIFSVSASKLSTVREYIANQEEHHRKKGFQQEFRSLLQRHGMEWDEQFVWD